MARLSARPRVQGRGVKPSITASGAASGPDMRWMRRPGVSFTHSLVESLGQAIVTGDYVESGFPNEGELSKQFGASRTVTREAVKMLTAKGLLSARPRHGTVVEPETEWNLLDPDVLRWLLERKFSLRLLAEFTEMRLGIEPAAAARPPATPTRPAWTASARPWTA
ncbi:transcriptional regulator [Caulobacter sp. AP07]|nr:transcriptional regulator [Caulobacter sp. AP07]